MAFNWEDNNDTFRDMPDEVQEGQEAPMPVIRAGNMSPQPANNLPTRVVQEEPEVLVEEFEEENFEAVLADANLRIDLASLYKLIMNHDLFDGMEGVDQRAIDTVHKEVRRFARERMEIMLGMRQETPKEAIVSSPFNDLEVVVLKKMASQMSKGATSTPAAQAPQPVAKAIARKEGLNTIGTAPKQLTKMQTSKPASPLAQKPQNPVQRAQKPQLPAPDEQEYKPLKKPLHEMSAQEILDRNKEASARQADRKPAKATGAIPQPTADQEEMFHTQRVIMSDNPLGSPNAVSAIVAALNKNKSQ